LVTYKNKKYIDSYNQEKGGQMNVKVLIAILLLPFFMSLKAQKSFEKGNILLNPAIGLGSNYVGRYGVNPSFSFSTDFGVHDYVSAGPYVGATFFNSDSYRNAFDFGGRVSFHWWQLLDDKVAADLKQGQLDIYFTFWMGYEIVRRRRNPPFWDDYYTRTRFDLGTNFGLRWYPNENKRFALFTELGYTPISWMLLGATIKLN
jgi:hypothetical protein